MNVTDIILYVNRNQPNGADYAIITDDHIRAIYYQMVSLGLIGAATVTKSEPTIKPAAPADDEATVKSLKDAYWNGETIVHDKEGFYGVLAAIRRGEVTGLPSPHAHEWLQAEVKRLMVERDTRGVEIAELKRLLFEVKDSAIVAERDVKFIRDTAEACKFFKLADSVWYKRMMKIADRMEGKT